MARPRKKPAEEAKAAEEAKTSTKRTSSKLKAYVTLTGNLMYHPFQRIMIPAGHPGVKLELDNWLKAQIKAGKVKEV